MAAVTICNDFGAQKIKSDFPLFPHLLPIKWWGQMPWSSFSEYWALSQLFHSPLSLSVYSHWRATDLQISSCKIETLYLLNNSAFSHLQPLPTPILLSVYINLATLWIWQFRLVSVESHGVCFSWRAYFLMPSSVLHIVACDRISFFLGLNNIPLYVYTTFCFFIRL